MAVAQRRQPWLAEGLAVQTCLAEGDADWTCPAVGPMSGAALAAKPGSALVLGPGTKTWPGEGICRVGAPCPGEARLDDEAEDCVEDHAWNGSLED